MAGYLKPIGDDQFCVEFVDRHVQILWRPGTAEGIARARNWISEKLPRLPVLPEAMLLTLIGNRPEFSSELRYEEKMIRWYGKTVDGGTVELVYFKDTALDNDERQEGADILHQWRSSYLHLY